MSSKLSQTIKIIQTAATATFTSSDIDNPNCRGVKVTLDVTDVSAGPSITLTIKAKDRASGKYTTLLAGAAVTTAVTNVYTVYPGLTAVANVTASDVVPEQLQVVVTANNANACTYTVGIALIP